MWVTEIRHPDPGAAPVRGVGLPVRLAHALDALGVVLLPPPTKPARLCGPLWTPSVKNEEPPF
jgi:hypothetical protein